MSNKIEINISQFNEGCKSLGLDPYPFDKVTINYQDREQFILSVKIWEDSLHRWISSQENKMPNIGLDDIR